MGKNTKVVVTKKPSKNKYKRDKKALFEEKHKEPKEKLKINWMYVLIAIVTIVIVVEAGLIISKKIKQQKTEENQKLMTEALKDESVRKFGNAEVTLPYGWVYENRNDENYKILDVYPSEDDLIEITSSQYSLQSLELTKEEMYQELYDNATKNVDPSQKYSLKDIKLGNYTWKTPESYIKYDDVYIRPFYYMSMKDGYVYSLTITSVTEVTDESLAKYEKFFNSMKIN